MSSTKLATAGQKYLKGPFFQRDSTVLGDSLTGAFEKVEAVLEIFLRQRNFRHYRFRLMYGNFVDRQLRLHLFGGMTARVRDAASDHLHSHDRMPVSIWHRYGHRELLQ